MAVSSPVVQKNLFVLQEDNIVRTGRLGYYDPLKMSDLFSQSLSSLNTVNDTLPSSGSNLTDLPTGINCTVFNIQYLGSGSIIASTELYILTSDPFSSGGLLVLESA